MGSIALHSRLTGESMHQWADQLGDIRKQIHELQKNLSVNESTASAHKEALQEAYRKVQQLVDPHSNQKESFYQLPLLLSSLNSQKLIWALLLAADGAVVMQHSNASRLLCIDALTNKLPDKDFFDANTQEPVAADNLPWVQALRGKEPPSSQQLKLRGQEGLDEIYLEVAAVSLRSGNMVSGAIILFRDMTETVQSANYIRRLCTNLEKQMAVAEGALRELKVLSDKLGIDTPPEAVRAYKPSSPATQKRALIVDDIPMNHTLFVMQLKKLGIDSDSVNNGLEAVDACKRQRYAVVFMDLGMPVMNGYEATAEIRRIDAKEGGHTPIVAMTAYDSEGDKEKCLKAGMDDYLPKGAGKSHIKAVVDRFIFGKDAAPGPAVEKVADRRPSGEKMLDVEWLEYTFGDDMPRAVTVFIDAATTLLNCLSLALEQKDLGAVNHFAFSLKGPCSTVGLTSMSKLAFDLSEDAAHDRWAAANEKCKVLLQVLSAVKGQAQTLSKGEYSAAP
jgi:CheY-like chemotaxis protein/HPt (histidine-containing phosphotransfer) domain-containing protein